MTGYAFDYFLKDHLGNVRMVLTDEQSQDAYPVASLESQVLDKEKVYYRILEGSVVNKAGVPGYPKDDTYTAPNDYVQRLNGNSQKVGTSIVLKVMSGDKVNIRASSWYRQSGITSGSSSSAIADIVASLVQGIAGVPGGKISVVTPEQQQVLSSGVTSFLRHQGSEPVSNVTKPKSYLNWLLLDEQLNPVITSDGQNSGFEQVGADQQLTIHQVTQRPVTKNGYLYIYLSNESPGVDVLFDNLQVTHIKGPLLEETHYYPFGLEMAGISSKAVEKVENKYKFNDGTERNTDLDINLDETDFRSYDTQIGRFIQIDPLSEFAEDWSPYTYAYNNPLLYNDPLGLAASADSSGTGFTPATRTELTEVTVTASKANCQTCNSSSPNIDVAGAVGPPPENGSSNARVTPVPQVPIKTTPYDPTISDHMPKFRIIPGMIGSATMALLATLWPMDGPSFPNNDEMFYSKHPEFLNPNSTPSAKNRDISKLYLVRFGDNSESKEELAAKAEMAQAGGYPYGVSTFLRTKPITNGRSALLLDVMRRFVIKKTGKPDHFTVVLPNPVTQGTANNFNLIFIKR